MVRAPIASYPSGGRIAGAYGEPTVAPDQSCVPSIAGSRKRNVGSAIKSGCRCSEIPFSNQGAILQLHNFNRILLGNKDSALHDSYPTSRFSRILNSQKGIAGLAP